MNQLRLAVLSLLVLLALVACSGKGEAPAAGATSAPVSLPAIATEAKGFALGSQSGGRTVYVFFDAQCPHCTELWEAAKPLYSQARFVWIPVAFINAASSAQGATILASADPAATMELHETSMRSQQGGISAGADIDAQREVVKKNTELLTRFGFSTVPTIVARHAQSGELVTQEGGSPTAALAGLLGLQIP
jgi:thiol:disulfide interchange protein DsbG